MDILGVVLALLAGVGVGGTCAYYGIARPLIKDILLMKREGFVTYPKTVRPPELPDTYEYRED